MGNYSDFKTKPIYKTSKELYQFLTSILNNKIPYPLKGQISRASMSIILNFSEGYGRFHKNDKKQFYIHSRASLNEVVTCFDLIQIHSAIDKEQIQKFNLLSEEIYKMISGLINSLK